MLRMYNPCTCGAASVKLVDDIRCEISIAGGMRVVCSACGRHTAVANWNSVTPIASPVA